MMKRFRSGRHFGFVVFFILLLPWSLEARSPTIRVATSLAPLNVVKMPVDDYLLGVLAQEVPKDWPEATLKAQAIAARTYALYRKNHPRHTEYDLRTDVIDQVFRHQADYPEVMIRAIQETEGEVLLWADQPIPAFYHSCCGGQTENPERVWLDATTYPFLATKKDPYCKNCPTDLWEYQLDKNELSLLIQLGSLGKGQVHHLLPYSWDAGRRIHEVAIVTDSETINMTSDELRELLGYSNLKSTYFNILEMGDELIFLGEGAGHGVGLCQWGAHEMGLQGKDYREILDFYYPSVAIKKIY